jgi:WD40 repeat protein
MEGEQIMLKKTKHLWLLAVLFISIFMAASVMAAGMPILQIDTGGHQAIIRDVIFTKDGKHLVSASEDKTVRVWDVKTGKTVRILRTQIGKGPDGKIYAAALSPDNKWLALGGYPSRWGIRLMDFKTGKIVGLLKGHSNVIFGLSFSKDNSLLISGSADKSARIWDVKTGQTLHILKGHKDHIYAVAFSLDSSFAVTGSDDHTLKLWNVSSGALIKTLRGHDDKVVSVAFTPDGKYILSNSYDKTIRLWDGNTGNFIKIFATLDSNGGNLSISNDGRYVLTGIGEDCSRTQCNIFSIPSGKKISEFNKHKNLILATDISPGISPEISSSSFIAATGGGDEKEIYLWDLKTGKEKAKMVGNGQIVWSVGFAKDGKSIAWGNTFTNRNLFAIGPLQKSFFLADKTGGLSADPALSNDNAYTRAIEKVEDISIRIKNNESHPTLQILKKDKVLHKITLGATDGYWHRSLTLTPDGTKVISGGGWGFLTSYDTKTGTKLRQFIGHNGDVWAVAVSSDGKRLVSGSSDQTVRLWDVETGALLMSLFYGTDGEWVAWTEEGFYSASADGEKYIGYHINNGEAHAADYVSVEQVGRIFYRPDLVAKKIKGGFETEIKAEVARLGDIRSIMLSGLPPEIKIYNKGKKLNRRNLILDYSVQDMGGGIGKIEFRVNNSLVASSDIRAVGNLNKSGVIGRIKRKEKHLTLSQGPNHISIIAYNKDNKIASRPADILINVDDPLNDAPFLYVIAAGITDYRDRSLKLKYAHSDAEYISRKFKERGKGLFKDVHVTSLINEKATREGIEQAFKDISDKIKPSDVFVLYFAGHGKAFEGEYHFIPWEALYESSEALQKASISHEMIKRLFVKYIPALKSLIILDTCASGITTRTRGMEEKASIERLKRDVGRTILAASSVEQEAAMEGHKNHGVFTWAVLEAMTGKADRQGKGYGTVSIDEIAAFARENVPEITKKKWGYEQIPMLLMQGDPFAVGCSQGFDNPGCKEK